MKCRLYTHILSEKCLVVLTFQLDIVLVVFLEISCRISSMTFTVMKLTNVSFNSRSYYMNWSIYQWKAGSVWLSFPFLSRVSYDQRRSETPLFLAMKMDVRCLHSAEGHWYLQYSQLYSASFEFINWIDYLITTIFRSQTMSTNGSPPKTTNMAPNSRLFASQQLPDDNVGASDNNAGNTPNKDTQFGQPVNQFHPPPPPRYSYPPSQPTFPDAPRFYHQAPFNMTLSSQPSSGATKRYPSYGA